MSNNRETKADLEARIARLQDENCLLRTAVHKEAVAKADAQVAAERHQKMVEAHALGLNVQAPAFEAALNTAIDFCGSWFTSVQGFDRNNFDGDCMLITSELSEAVEADRTNAKDDRIPEFDGREAELADALVRLLHMASKYKLRLAKAYVAKQHFNLTRPFKHGKGY